MGIPSVAAQLESITRWLAQFDARITAIEAKLGIATPGIDHESTGTIVDAQPQTVTRLPKDLSNDEGNITEQWADKNNRRKRQKFDRPFTAWGDE